MGLGRGYVQVYTGDGKGKTTAAIGLAVRALGAGMRVAFLQFMKGRSYSEHAALARLGPGLVVETFGKPFFVAREGEVDAEALARLGGGCVVFEPGKPPEDYVRLVGEGLARAREAVTGGGFDLVVLDELNMAVHFGLAAVEDVLALLDARRPDVEVVLTGRNAPAAIIERADLVTEMRERKHWFATTGVAARRGIDC